MDINGIVIDFDPGDTYQQRRIPEGGMRDPDPKERADGRVEAVKKFRENAARVTQQQIAKSVTPVIALCIQLRALGGSFTDTDLKNQLKEIVDFMEDV